jgi:hypothetical protein
MAEIVAMADAVADEVVDDEVAEEPDTRSRNLHIAKGTIIPL